MSGETLKSWMEEWSGPWGVEIEFDENSVCSLQVKDDFVFTVAPAEEDESLFVLAAPLVTVSNDPLVDLDLLQEAMVLNQFQLKTMGGTLAYIPALGSILFLFSYPFEKCDPLSFGTLLMNYLDVAMQLRNDLLACKEKSETDMGKRVEREESVALTRNMLRV
jgi:Tir chaperone protein (CesT) family